MTCPLSDADLLARLVAFDSTSRNSNLPIAEFICDYLEHPNIEIARRFNEDQTKVNLIVRLTPSGSTHKQTDPRSGLILSGHMDVVPAEEPDWLSNPFELTENEDSYIGRGACDMKGFVALAINAMRATSENPPKQPLVLVLTYDEEPGTLGAAHLARTWDEPFPLPRSAIIGEPTSLRVVRMHKGHVKMRVTTSGRSAHSGYPHLGINAIEPMGHVIGALSELRQQWERERVESSVFFADTPYVALNVANVRGGSAVNIVPEQCTLDFGFRPLPGMGSERLVQQIREAVAGVTATDRTTVEMLVDSPPLLTNENAPIYSALCSLVGQTETVGVSYASDAGPLATMGIECVVWGPGTIEVAHKPNESMPKEEFARARGLLDRVIKESCA